MHDAIQMGIQGGETTATAEEVVMTKVALDEATVATAKSSRLAVTTRTRGMIPHLIEP